MTRIRTLRAAVALGAVAVLASACAPGSPEAAGDHGGPAGGGHTAGQAAGRSTVAAASSPSPRSSGATTTPTPASASDCRTTQLRISLEGGGSGTAGSTFQQLVFTNTGKDTCILDGFPGVSYVRQQDGAPIGAAAERVDQPSLVSLAPGERAVAPLQSTDPQNYPEDRCKPVTAHGLRVYPPNETTSAFVKDVAQTCADASVRVLRIYAVKTAS